MEHKEGSYQDPAESSSRVLCPCLELGEHWLLFHEDRHHRSDLRREHGPARNSGKIQGLVHMCMLRRGWRWISCSTWALLGSTSGGGTWLSPRFMCMSEAPQPAGFPEGSTEPLSRAFSKRRTRTPCPSYPSPALLPPLFLCSTLMFLNHCCFMRTLEKLCSLYLK